MQDKSGLAGITDSETILNTRLDKFVEKTPFPVHIIKDDTDIRKWMANYMKEHPTGKSKVFVFTHEILYQYQTMTKIFPGIHIFYGTLSSYFAFNK